MSLTGQSVLVVEDEMLLALDTVDELQNAGCRVIGPALRLGTAIPLAQTAPLNAAVLDVNLAGEYVWPVAGILASRGVPFIFLTGCGAALEFPADFAAFPRLEKPAVPGLVVRTLGSVIFRIK